MVRSLSRAMMVAGISALAAGAVSAQDVGLKVGDKAAAYKFSGLQVNGDGRTELNEFRGNVVMLDWWGNT